MSLTVGKKLLIGVGTLVLFLFFLGASAIFSVSTIADHVHEIVGKTSKKQLLAATIQAQSATLLGEERGLLMRGYQKDTKDINADSERFIATAKEMQVTTDTLLPLLTTAKTKGFVADVQEELAKMLEANRMISKAAMAGDMATGDRLFNTVLKPAAKRQNDAALTIIDIQKKRFSDASKGAEDAISISRWTVGVLFTLGALVGVVLTLVVGQINRALRNSVVEMAEAATQIASAASQVSNTSQSQAQGASEQAAMIEETSAATTEISSMAQRAAESSKTTAEIVARSQEGFRQTNSSLASLEGAMAGINESSEKISQIIKVIDGIAFQTNILALNAAVEAARAGEAGMGFAVVADEVRSLAQRSAQAAKDTGSLIEESIDRAKQGQTRVNEVVEAIRSITAETFQIKNLVDETRDGSMEQTRGLDQISRAIMQMEQVTQTNAAGAEEGAAAAEQLNAQAEMMKEVVESLRVMVDGASPDGRAGIRRSVGAYA
jgi:methyl-accepting chemotaxis protein/methyl-accepting chemotaxis protein-1 (serine sensor receptor)